MAELADTSTTSGTRTARQEALLTVDQNFYGLAVNRHANTVIVRLGEDDCFFSQYASAFPYDPWSRPKPQFSVAEELIVSVAQKYGMKVIFVIDISDYHKDVNDGFDYIPNSHDATGAYSFIHSVIDPTVYYGNLQTTDLASVGLSDHSTRSFIGDSRIAGWYLDGEWNLNNAQQVQFWKKYWPFFYSTVHYGGAATSFTGAYVAAAPDSGIATAQSTITAFKQFFSTNIVSTQRPDQYGFEWYGNNSYALANISTDLQTLAGTMSSAVFSVPYSHIQLMEGGTNQTGASGLSQFYLDAINKTASLGLSGISVWLSDGNINTGNCTSGDDAGTCPSSHQKCFALALNSSSPIPIDGCKTYTPPPQEWHYILTPCPSCVPSIPYCNTTYGDVCINGSTGPYIHQCGSNPGYAEQCLFTVGYGPITWATPTTAGSAVASGFGSH